MHRYHGLNLWADLGTERLPWCRFRAFVASLPPDSAFVRSQVGGTSALSVDTQLLAMVADNLRLWVWLNADPKSRGARPAPLLGSNEQQTVGDEIARRLIEQRDKKEV